MKKNNSIIKQTSARKTGTKQNTPSGTEIQQRRKLGDVTERQSVLVVHAAAWKIMFLKTPHCNSVNTTTSFATFLDNLLNKKSFCVEVLTISTETADDY